MPGAAAAPPAEVATCESSARVFVRGVWGDARPSPDCPDCPKVQGVYILLRHTECNGMPVYAGPLDPRLGYSPTYPGPCRIFSSGDDSSTAHWVVSPTPDAMKPRKGRFPGAMKSDSHGGRPPYSQKYWKVANLQQKAWVPTLYHPVWKLDAKVRLYFYTSSRPHTQGMYELVDYVNRQPCWACRNLRIWSCYSKTLPTTPSEREKDTLPSSYWVVSELVDGAERRLVRSEVSEGKPPYQVRQWQVYAARDSTVPCEVAVHPVETANTSTLGFALKSASEQVEELQAIVAYNMSGAAPSSLHVTCSPSSLGAYEGLYTLASSLHNSLPYWEAAGCGGGGGGPARRIYCGVLGRWHISANPNCLRDGFAGARSEARHCGKLPHEVESWCVPVAPSLGGCSNNMAPLAFLAPDRGESPKAGASAPGPPPPEWASLGVVVRIAAKGMPTPPHHPPSESALRTQVKTLQREIQTLRARGAGEGGHAATSVRIAIYEHQRWAPGSGWGDPDLPGDPSPWLDASTREPFSDLEEVVVPPGRRWLCLWSVDRSASTRGWEYAHDFPEGVAGAALGVAPPDGEYRPARGSGDRVRRRLWVRKHGSPDQPDSDIEDARDAPAAPGDAACDDIEFVDSDDDDAPCTPHNGTLPYEVPECYAEALHDTHPPQGGGGLLSPVSGGSSTYSPGLRKASRLSSFYYGSTAKLDPTSVSRGASTLRLTAQPSALAVGRRVSSFGVTQGGPALASTAKHPGLVLEKLEDITMLQTVDLGQTAAEPNVPPVVEVEVEVEGVQDQQQQQQGGGLSSSGSSRDTAAEKRGGLRSRLSLSSLFSRKKKKGGGGGGGSGGAGSGDGSSSSLGRHGSSSVSRRREDGGGGGGGVGGSTGGGVPKARQMAPAITVETTPATPMGQAGGGGVFPGGGAAGRGGGGGAATPPQQPEKFSEGGEVGGDQQQQQPSSAPSSMAEGVQKRRAVLPAGSPAAPAAEEAAPISAQRKAAALRLLESEVAAFDEDGEGVLHSLARVGHWLAVLEEPLGDPDDGCHPAAAPPAGPHDAMRQLIETEMQGTAWHEDLRSVARLRRWLGMLEGADSEAMQCGSLPPPTPQAGAAPPRNPQLADALSRVRRRVEEQQHQQQQGQPCSPSATEALAWELFAAKRVAGVIALSAAAAARAACQRWGGGGAAPRQRQPRAPLFTLVRRGSGGAPQGVVGLEDGGGAGSGGDSLLLELPRGVGGAAGVGSGGGHHTRRKRGSGRRAARHAVCVVAAAVAATAAAGRWGGAGGGDNSHVLIALSLACTAARPDLLCLGPEALLASLRKTLAVQARVDASRLRGMKIYMGDSDGRDGAASAECTVVCGGTAALRELRAMPVSQPLAGVPAWCVVTSTACLATDLLLSCPQGHPLLPSAHGTSSCSGPHCARRQPPPAHPSAYACQRCRFSVCERCFQSLLSSRRGAAVGSVVPRR